MASSLEFVEFILEQLGEGASYKRMFGEYGVYYEGKYFGAICDDRFLIKITDAGKRLLPNGETQPPYEGGSPMYYITELDDRAFLRELVRETCAALPAPKPKKRRERKE